MEEAEVGNPALAPAAAVMQQHTMLLWGEAANQRAAWAGGGRGGAGKGDSESSQRGQWGKSR